MNPTPSQSLCDLPVCSEERQRQQREKNAPHSHTDSQAHTQTQPHTRSAKEEIRSAEKNMIAGGLAGCIGKTLTAPLSRLTVLYQVGPLLERAHLHSHTHTSTSSSGSSSSSSSISHTTTTHAHTASQAPRITQNSILQTLRSVIQREGVLSLWNGNFVSVLHRFPYSAINFATYEACREHLSSADAAHDSSTTRFVCGAVSGAVSCISCYPLDIVRTRLAVGSAALSSSPSLSSLSASSPSSSLLSSFTTSTQRSLRNSRAMRIVLQILETEGLFGLYRGLGASLTVVMPNLALSFTVYGKAKEWMIDSKGVFYNPETKHLNSYGSLVSGCISGATSSMILFPLDVIRKRLQVMGVVPGATANTPLPSSSLSNTASSSSSSSSSSSPSSSSAADVAGTGAEAAKKTRPGMVYHARMIYAHHGLRGFYRGLSTEILKVCPMVAITFCAYETVKDLLDQRFPSHD